ncbi:MAG: hypothetical protein V4623_09995 [Pseudomonadota bacterium]
MIRLVSSSSLSSVNLDDDFPLALPTAHDVENNPIYRPSPCLAELLQPLGGSLGQSIILANHQKRVLQPTALLLSTLLQQAGFLACDAQRIGGLLMYTLALDPIFPRRSQLDAEIPAFLQPFVQILAPALDYLNYLIALSQNEAQKESIQLPTQLNDAENHAPSEGTSVPIRLLSRQEQNMALISLPPSMAKMGMASSVVQSPLVNFAMLEELIREGKYQQAFRALESQIAGNWDQEETHELFKDLLLEEAKALASTPGRPLLIALLLGLHSLGESSKVALHEAALFLSKLKPFLVDFVDAVLSAWRALAVDGEAALREKTAAFLHALFTVLSQHENAVFAEFLFQRCAALFAQTTLEGADRALERISSGQSSGTFAQF